MKILSLLLSLHFVFAGICPMQMASSLSHTMEDTNGHEAMEQDLSQNETDCSKGCYKDHDNSSKNLSFSAESQTKLKAVSPSFFQQLSFVTLTYVESPPRYSGNYSSLHPFISSTVLRI